MSLTAVATSVANKKLHVTIGSGVIVLF